MDVTVHEGSVVGNPAYPDTEVSIRSLDEAKSFMAERRALEQRAVQRSLGWFQRAQAQRIAERR